MLTNVNKRGEGLEHMRVDGVHALAKEVKYLRKRAGLSQTELAEKIGASRSWVARLERGEERLEVRLVFEALWALGQTIQIFDAHENQERLR